MGARIIALHSFGMLIMFFCGELAGCTAVQKSDAKLQLAGSRQHEES
jgi:hypothetical protein